MELPHKEPIKFVDSYSMSPPDTLIAEYTIPENHPVFEGHFPHISVWPGVYLIEGMNQAAGLHALNLAEKISNSDIDQTKIITFVTSVDKVKFRQPCFPGDKLEYNAVLVKERSGHLFYQCKVYKDGKSISSATVGLTAKTL